jgi:hypothetical protein
MCIGASQLLEGPSHHPIGYIIAQRVKAWYVRAPGL